MSTVDNSPQTATSKFEKMNESHSPSRQESNFSILKSRITQLAEHLSQNEPPRAMKIAELNERYVGFIMNVKQSLAHTLEAFKDEFGAQIAFVRAVRIEKFTVRVTDMRCHRCVKSLEDTLGSVGDVLAMNVDLAQKLLHTYLSKNSSALKVIHQLTVAGRTFEPVHPNTYRRYFMEKTSMRCGGCASKIRSTLQDRLGESLYHVHTNVDTKEVEVIANLDDSNQVDRILRDDMQKEFITVQPDTLVHSLHIEGMKCGSCTGKVTKALEETPGVIAAKIVRNDESLVYASLPREEIITIIQEAGFSVKGETASSDILSAHQANNFDFQNGELSANQPSSSNPPEGDKQCVIDMPLISPEGPDEDVKSLSFTVTGMSCASCVMKIENKVKNLPGVLGCTVSLLSQRANVLIDEVLTDSTDVERTIHSLGFGAEKIEQLNDDEVLLSVPHLNNSTMSIIIANLDQERVRLVESNFSKATIKLEFQPATVKVRQIIHSLEEAGVMCHLVNDDQASREHLLRSAEIRLYRNLFFFSLGFTIVAMIIGMILGHLPFLHPVLGFNIFRGLTPHFVLLFLFVTPVQFIGGSQFYKLSFKAVRAMSPDMNTLISIGAWVSYLLSIFNMIYAMIVWSPSVTFQPANYMETSAGLITFLLLGRVIENYAKSKTSSALVALLDLSPKTAQLVEREDKSQSLFEVPVEEIDAQLLATGDIFKVSPGEKIAADGVVIHGESSCDEAMITGESVPVSKVVNEEVIGGTVNVDGILFVEVTRVGHNSTLAKIAKLVEEAQSEKPALQAVVDRISAVFVPAVLLISATVFMIWVVLGYTVIPSNWIPEGLNPLTLALIFGASVTVVACPCALGLATPLAIMVGTGIGAKHGVLIKGGHALEQAKKTSAICFDKTGTLTEGKLSVDHYVLTKDESHTLFEILGGAEASSEHPIAKAVVNFCKRRLLSAEGEYVALEDRDEDLPHVSFPEAENFKNIPGRGLNCTVKGRTVAVGNLQHLLDQNVHVEQTPDLQNLQHGHTMVYMAVDGEFEGAFGLSDEVRSQAKRLVRKLQSMKIAVYMVTGDNHDVAQTVGTVVGIESNNIRSNMTPEGKKQVIEELQAQKHIVMHVGDGINDSPALAQANIGLAVGEGTDIAMECADVVLVKNNLEGIVTAIHLSRATYRRILINLSFAFGYNLVAVPLAAGILFPIPGLHWIIPPWVAGVAMGLSSISVT
eukprot:CAMPEP_0117436818 /NCGR_PEP_ID=MMETSP0759-20121206/1203_1 /TAXON_ID=63605 /ORGANISM="Percolomonas cosmopolitus, Strain WS" /LENGTH=1215 /DNA_ID=CAMNT_0005228429 /DNA_START=336 /DNA_END=3979 /DNA_ORIENTATION=-